MATTCEPHVWWMHSQSVAGRNRLHRNTQQPAVDINQPLRAQQILFDELHGGVKLKI